MTADNQGKDTPGSNKDDRDQDTSISRAPVPLSSPNVEDLRARLGLTAKPAKRSISDKFLEEIQKDMSKSQVPEKKEPEPEAPTQTSTSSQPLFPQAETIVAPAAVTASFIGDSVEMRIPTDSIPYKETNVAKMVWLLVGVGLACLFLVGVSYWFGKAFSFRDEINKSIFQAEQVKKVLTSKGFKTYLGYLEEFKTAIDNEHARLLKMKRIGWQPSLRFIAACSKFGRVNKLSALTIVRGTHVWNNKLVAAVHRFVDKANALRFYARVVSGDSKEYAAMIGEMKAQRRVALRFKPSDKPIPALGTIVAFNENARIQKQTVQEVQKDKDGNDVKDKKGQPVTVSVEKYTLSIAPLEKLVVMKVVRTPKLDEHGKPVKDAAGRKVFVEKQQPTIQVQPQDSRRIIAVETKFLVLFNPHQLMSKGDRKLLRRYEQHVQQLSEAADAVYYKTLVDMVDKEAKRPKKFTF